MLEVCAFFGCGSGGSLPPFSRSLVLCFPGLFSVVLLYRIIRASGRFSFSSFRVGVRFQVRVI
jgi:hypothetical protein